MTIIENFQNLKREDYDLRYWRMGMLFIFLMFPLMGYFVGLGYGMLVFMIGIYFLFRSVNISKVMSV